MTLLDRPYIYLDMYSFCDIISQTLLSDVVILLSLLSIGSRHFNRKYFTYVVQNFFQYILRILVIPGMASGRYTTYYYYYYYIPTFSECFHRHTYIVFIEFSTDEKIEFVHKIVSNTFPVPHRSVHSIGKILDIIFTNLCGDVES